MKVLLVDDDPFYLEILAQMVEGWGHEAVRADSGVAALDRAAGESFDVFLLDVFLPDMTALELIPRLKTFHPVTPIITVTGHSTRELELRLRELGIAFFASKPILQAELKNLLDHIRRHGALSGTPPRRISSKRPLSPNPPARPIER